MIIFPDQFQRLFSGGSLQHAVITPLQGAGLQMVTLGSDGPVSLPPATEYRIQGDNPPAYLLSVPAVWAVPSPGFMPHQSHIDYEVCTRYCDHSFTSESGVPVTAGWLGAYQARHSHEHVTELQPHFPPR